MRKSKKGFFRLFAYLIFGVQFFSTPTITGLADEMQGNVFANQ